MSGSTTKPSATARDWRQWLAEQFGQLDRWFEGRFVVAAGPEDAIVRAESLLSGDRLKSLLVDVDKRQDYAQVHLDSSDGEAERLLQAIGADETRGLSISASLLTGSYLGPLTTVAIIGLAAGVGFDLAPRQSTMVLVNGMPRRLLLGEPGRPLGMLAAVDGVDDVPASVQRVHSTADLRSLVWRSLYGDHLAPVFRRVAEVTKIPPAVMWTNAAEWLAMIHESALTYLDEEAATPLMAECQALLKAESLPGVDDDRNPLREKIDWTEVTVGSNRYEVQTRRLCTLAYLLAKRSARMCGTCPYLKPEDRVPIAHELYVAPFETKSTSVTMGMTGGAATQLALAERLRRRSVPASTKPARSDQ
jgi:hypothetical protein